MKSLLPELVRAEGIRWTLVAPAGTLAALKMSDGWSCRVVPHPGFFAVHFWEQAILPLWAHMQGMAVTLCNSHYVPLLAPNARSRWPEHDHTVRRWRGWRKWPCW